MAGMMKQDSNYIKNRQSMHSTPVLITKKDLKPSDLILELTKSSKEAIFKLNLKKKVLRDFVSNTKDILKASEAADANMDTESYLFNFFKNRLPTSQALISRSSNDELAQKLVDLYEPSKLLLQHLLEEEKKATLLRSNKRRYITVFIEDFVSRMTEVENMALEDMNNAMHQYKSPPLTIIQRERKFDPNRVPKFVHHRVCVFCDHESINLLPENDEIHLYNKEIDRVYAKKLEVWQKFLSKKEKDPDTKHPDDPIAQGKIMKRAPMRAKHKNAIIKCMCLTSMCIKKDDNSGSSCPIKCKNKQTGERYPHEGNPRVCTCPVCSCTCSRAIYVTDFDLLRLANRNANCSNQQSNSDTKAYLGSMFKIGLDAALSEQKNKILAQIVQQETKKRKTSKATILSSSKQNVINLDDINENCMYTFNETVALNIGKHADQHLSKNEKQEIATQFGNHTVVKLPSGHRFSTKTIANNSNKHMHSNKLSSTSKPLKSPSPGMLDNVKIDLSVKPYTEDYLCATADFNMSKNEIIILDDDDKVPRVTSGETPTQNTPRSRALARVKKRVATQMHYGKQNLTTRERMQRRRAQNLTMDLVKNKDTTKDVIEVVCADMDISTDNYCSQEVVSRVSEYFDFERKANSERK